MTAGSNNIVTDGLVACWDAGNRRSYPGAGTTWTDVVGGNEGTLENMDTGGFDSQKGGVIEFDGTDEYVDTGSNQILPDGRNPFTISLWLKPESGGDDWNSLYMFKQDDNPDGTDERSFQVQWLTRAGYSSSFYCGVRGLTSWGPAENIGADREDWYDKWCCVTVTYNGEGTKSGHANYRLYINDVNYALGDLNTQGGVENRNRLGVNHGSSPISEFKGDMANLSVWNRALSVAEIKQNYKVLKPRFEPRIPKEGLMGYWDAGDPQCFAGNMVNQYAASTWNLIDLCSGTIGEFDNGNPLPNFSLDNGGYWTFDGTDDGIWAGMGAPNDMYLQYSNANGITGIEWVNLASDGTNVFFWKNDMFQFRYDGSNKLNMRSGNATSWSDSADLKSAADLLTTDGSAWACVAASANKSNDAREIWLNGVRVANDTGSGMRWGTDNERMGVAGGWGSDTLHGKVGMALLYSRALSAAEIKDFYNKTKARFGH